MAVHAKRLHIFLPVPDLGQDSGSACETSASNINVTLNNCNYFAHKVHTEMFTKFITLPHWSASYKK